jgi:fructuronate reductase
MTGDGRLRLTPASARSHRVPVLPRTPARQAGIVHLGLSNFHRAHQAVHTARALDVDDGPWGIVGVARRSRDVLDAMRAQESAYAVLTLADDRADVDVVAVHTDLLLAAADPEAVVARLADPAISLVTLTVTEAGYTAHPGQGGLDVGDAELAADLDGRPPLTTVGQLAGALRRRHRTDAPCTVLSCDNPVGNGAMLRRLVTEFLERCVPEPERGELLDWCASRVRFPGSMVDRIVPRTTDRHREVVRTRIGLSDASPVPAEEFSMWVVEDDFATARPAWDRVGAIFSEDVHGYEVLKIRLLNGTHSLLAYLGMLIGAPTIAAAVADDDVRAAAEAFLDEMSSTCVVPAEVSLPAYRASLLERFANAATGHLTSQVGTDGSLKVPARIPQPVAIRASRGQRSPLCALLVAAFVRVMSDPAAVEDPIREGLRDPALAALTALGTRYRRERDRVRAVLLDTPIFPQALGQDDDFLAACVELGETCRRGGVRAAIEAARTAAHAEEAADT